MSFLSSLSSSIARAPLAIMATTVTVSNVCTLYYLDPETTSKKILTILGTTALACLSTSTLHKLFEGKVISPLTELAKIDELKEKIANRRSQLWEEMDPDDLAEYQRRKQEQAQQAIANRMHLKKRALKAKKIAKKKLKNQNKSLGKRASCVENPTSLEKFHFLKQMQLEMKDQVDELMKNMSEHDKKLC